jgi:DNA-binding CsgD family transcriptional regulator
MNSTTSDEAGRPQPASLASFVLRVRTLAALERAGILTVGQVRSLSDQDLLGVTNLGPKSVADLRQAMVERNLGDDDPLSRLASSRPLSDRDEKIVQMRAAGEQLSVIARRFGMSRSRAAQILDRARTSSASPTG